MFHTVYLHRAVGLYSVMQYALMWMLRETVGLGYYWDILWLYHSLTVIAYTWLIIRYEDTEIRNSATAVCAYPAHFRLVKNVRWKTLTDQIAALANARLHSLVINHHHHHIYFRLPERPQKPIELAIIKQQKENCKNEKNTKN